MKSKYSKIALGGVSGTGKGTISKMLAEKLGFEKVSVGDFAREFAAKEGISMFDLDKRLKENPEEADKLDKIFDERTAEYGKNHENFVFEGRLTAHFIKDSYRILLTGNENETARRIAQRDGVTQEEALEEVQNRDNLLRKRFDKLYNLADFDDPKYYDLVIDTSELTPEEILEIIIKNITE